MSYLQSYLDRIRGKGNPALADAIHKTVEDIVPQYISNFSFTDHVVSLLVGDVQSGKTSHMIRNFGKKSVNGKILTTTSQRNMFSPIPILNSNRCRLTAPNTISGLTRLDISV